MKVAYPASDQLSRLNNTQRALKIARHSPCSMCMACTGLKPLLGVDVYLDQQVTNESSLGDLGQYGSDADDGDSDLPYLETCTCGHDVAQHNADEFEIGAAEFARRTRVAIRLDELLNDVGKLLDFDYIDDDITSLRRQMRIPVSLVSPLLQSSPSPDRRFTSVPLSPASSLLSDLPQPSNKKRHASISSLSDAGDDDDDDDEEDRPLAARMANKTSARPEKTSRAPASKRNGNKKAKKAQTAPTSVAPPTGEEQAQMNSQVNGINGHNSKVKVEDMMDEGQLTRLVAGVTVDTGGKAPAVPPTKTEKIATVEIRRGIIQVTPVENDQQPRSLVILAGLKTLFQKQLPNMPREYIARLVLDTNSRGLAIIKRGYKVVGGICFRPFPHRGFAEIVFFATASADQEKGYGGMLMDHFKAHIKNTYSGMMHFLTYADNYAVGYFEKQGFSKDITLDRAKWAAYIKDYEGGTIMQCTMLREVDYLNKQAILARQQEAVMAKIRQMSKSHIIYPGLPQFQPGASEGVIVDPNDVPGLRKIGVRHVDLCAQPANFVRRKWLDRKNDTENSEVRPVARDADTYHLGLLLKELQDHPQAWPFLQPVKAEEVPDYYEVIRNPMDFSTMEKKLHNKEYPTIEAFATDAQLVFDNCKSYNPEATIYHRNAVKLEKFFKDQLLDQVKREG